MTTHNYDIINSLDKRIITLQNGSIIKDEKNTPHSDSHSPEPISKPIIKKGKKKKDKKNMTTLNTTWHHLRRSPFQSFGLSL